MATKGDIDRLGDKIRSHRKHIDEFTLEALQQYRISHRDTLFKIFSTLCSLAHKVNKHSIITYRIKRFESIISKLHRYPDMKFSRMWDVAGCRCIFSSNAHVMKLRKLIDEHPQLTIKKEYDYISQPQSDGYKSLHLFLSIPDSSLTIEVQLRCEVDHNWATLVEISDLLFDAQLKEFSKDKKLLRFHRLLAKKASLEMYEQRVIADTIKKYKYLEKLSDVFTRNYLQVRKQWLEAESGQYFLIETRKNEVPKITSFKNVNDAENAYFSAYKSSRHVNIVLTHLPIPNYYHISTAYSNYILTFHAFLTDCYDIIEALLSNSLTNKEHFAFIKYYSLYNNILYYHTRNLLSEIAEINNLFMQQDRKKFKLKAREKEWISDLQKQISVIHDRQRGLRRMYRNKIQGAFIFRWLAKRIAKRFEAKHKALLKLYEQKPK